MKLYLRTVILVSLGTLVTHTAMAQTTSSAAASREQAIRKDVQEKQQALAREMRNETAAPVAAPAAPLALPIDETDSPGATK